MTATDQLAEFVASTRLADIPADVVARARLVLADCVGCMVAGAVVPEVRRLAALHVNRGDPAATVLGTGQRLAADAASFINGTAGTWHDLDEGNLSTRTHAGIQLLPAALAEAELRGLSGARLLEAVILSYEVSARIWRATKARLSVHPHGTYGPLAAATALAKLRGDNAPTTSNAQRYGQSRRRGSGRGRGSRPPIWERLGGSGATTSSVLRPVAMLTAPST